MEYLWSIGFDSNIMAEAYRLWKGMLKVKGVEEAIVFGDSRLISEALNGASQSQNLRLARLIKRIKSLSKTFRCLESFHILREVNDLADQAANKSMVLSKNEILFLSSALPP